ncbi:heterokaryon incompatibility protein-domain-containing protein [Alternaria rosae]|uniref:heterokaryon incompatibility protein-domain-containing protein n=1 Tax=Alternaria rosae TaxID=1187941 RepID=UPI001E8DAC2A|nr:heterokaryon incompatibility protein-domain-containing protein [Alternaria rosae]KAH6881551.1 heterokaryon incompatibility protein-domain-containing protein [Alternaria rosae]
MSFAVNSTTYNYQYRPLNHATQQIRLVTLLRPLENDDAIRLDINVFEISEAPPYTALSYVWGPPPSNHDIYIANGRLAIRENLFKFLTEFGNCRDKAPSDQHLWIDQLCIDQSTTAERNHQVQMMSDIYSKANSVIAWLGEGSKKADASPSILAQRGCDMFENMYDAAGVWKHVGEPAALAYVLHNEYFTRIWIVQEFILARQIRVLVKDIWLVDDTRGWERRADTLDDYLRHSVSSSTFRLIGRSSFRRAGGFFKHLDICVALDDYVTNDCADPRDRVYGLLGLSCFKAHLSRDGGTQEYTMRELFRY